MKGMSNGHDKSALFFGYGVNEAEPLIVEISEQNKDTWQLRTENKNLFFVVFY